MIWRPVARAFILRAALAAVCLGTQAQAQPAPAAPQPPPAPPSPPMASDEQLDALLAARDWEKLAAALTQLGSRDDLGRSMRWLRVKLEAGGGALLGFLYARDLWAVGENMKVDDPNKDVRITAAMITLYTYAIVELAGARCQDPAAAGRRADQLVAARRAALDYLGKQRPDFRAKVVDLALGLERRTALLRDEDEFVCNSSGNDPKAAQFSPPVEPALRQQREAQIRAGMKASLLRLITL